jgi:pantoate--beta-alanine ligase
MFTYSTRNSLESALQEVRNQNGRIGFVPTMGALHEGHLSLVKSASSDCDVVVVSIYVNPTQFNNQEDFLKYPKTLNQDLQLLNEFPKVIVYVPSNEEVYPENDHFQSVELGQLDEVLEGKFRPGHFQGVVHVVRNLLNAVNPHLAYFGLKDFQQLAVIRKFALLNGLKTQIIACDTLREPSGLALSSRNLRLTEKEKIEALVIYKTLEQIKNWRKLYTPREVKKLALEFFRNGSLKLEYLEIIDGDEFLILEDEWSENSLCCIAAYCGEVRLIDNMFCQ